MDNQDFELSREELILIRAGLQALLRELMPQSHVDYNQIHDIKELGTKILSEIRK